VQRSGEPISTTVADMSDGGGEAYTDGRNKRTGEAVNAGLV
jgi:hypothetical protein